ncbi:MAG: SDR family oxidoreductase [Myxococcales bacterium]
MTGHALVTGYPRLLARRIAETLRARSPEGRISVLASDKHAQHAQLFARGIRAEVLVGDISSLHLGLSTEEYREAVETVTDVLHAAEWSFLGATLEEMRRVNVEGTRSALDFAADCRKLRRFTHFSTVYVSGDREGVVAEDELDCGQAFRNSYEQTKFEAEGVVRSAMTTIPCTVLRPSIIVGDTKTGEIDRFEGPYVVAILLVTSPLQVAVPLPGNGVAPLNVVPIDYVVAAAAHIHGDERAVGRTFHLADPNPSSSRRIYELIAERQGRKLPRLSLGYRVADAILRLPGLEKLTREQRTAIAYVNHLSFFSTRGVLEILDGTGIRCPPIEGYLDTLIEYVRAEYKRKRDAS